MAFLSKSKLDSLFLVLLMVLEDVHIATGTSSQALVFKKDKEFSRCGQVIKKATVVADVICALTCSREPNCVGFNFGIACDACLRSCQITSSFGLCEDDTDFNFYKLQRPRVATTEAAPTTPMTATPTMTKFSPLMLSTTTALVTIQNGDTTSTVTTIATANNPTLSETTALTTVPDADITTPVTIIATANNPTPSQTTLFTTIPDADTATTFTTIATSSNPTPSTTTTASSTTAIVPDHYELVDCEQSLSSGLVAVGFRMSLDGVSLDSIYMTNVKMFTTPKYFQPFGTTCEQGHVVAHVLCLDKTVKCRQPKTAIVGSEVMTIKASIREPFSNFKSTWCPTNMLAYGIEEIYVDGDLSTLAVNCIEIIGF